MYKTISNFSFALQDYARLHNYNVLTPCHLADPTLTNMWNKIGWLLKAMQVTASPKNYASLASHALPQHEEARFFKMRPCQEALHCSETTF